MELQRNGRGLIINPAHDQEARPMIEADRVAQALADIKAMAAVPYQCGDAIPVAPARGVVLRYTPQELVRGKDGRDRVEWTGYRGRDGARVRDVFDTMTEQAERAYANRCKAKKDAAFTPPFTWGQVMAGRDYAALTERCNASGVKCSSLEALRQASSGGGCRDEAIFRDFARLRALHRRIGDGLAKQLRRHRPSESSAGQAPRRAIRVRYLVDQVCLADRSLSEILKGNGWSGNSKQTRDFRAELCMALDRMQGYEGDDPQNMG